jgi:hypothetical protein
MLIYGIICNLNYPAHCRFQHGKSVLWCNSNKNQAEIYNYNYKRVIKCPYRKL